MSLLILVVAAIGVFSLGVMVGLIMNAPSERARPYDWSRDGE